MYTRKRKNGKQERKKDEREAIKRRGKNGQINH